MPRFLVFFRCLCAVVSFVVGVVDQKDISGCHADLLRGTRIDILPEQHTGTNVMWHSCKLVHVGDVPGVQAAIDILTSGTTAAHQWHVPPQAYRA
jgi:hypothetical protein